VVIQKDRNNQEPSVANDTSSEARIYSLLTTAMMREFELSGLSERLTKHLSLHKQPNTNAGIEGLRSAATLFNVISVH
jgi:hypothetical protein